MIRQRSRRSLLLAVVGLSVAAGLLAERVGALMRAAPTDFDDAYMYLRYASHFLSGHGLAWNAGEASVYGVTSLLHLAVVAVLRWSCARLGPAGIVQLASGAAAMAFLLALVAVVGTWARHPRLHRNWGVWTVVIVPLVAYHEAFGFHAGTGMDTMLSALANTVLVCATLRLARRADVFDAGGAALASVLAVLVRPDNLICAIFCPVLAVALRPGSTRATRGKQIVMVATLSVGALASLVLFQWRLLGTPVPLSFFAKQPRYYGAFAGEFTWNPFLFLRVFLLTAWPFVASLILLGDGRGLRRAVVLLAPAAASMAVLFRFNQIMGHLGRFYYPFLPFVVVAGALQLDRALCGIGRGRAERPKRILARGVALAVMMAGGSVSLSAGASWYERRAQEQPLVQVGGFHVPAGASLPEIDSWRSAHVVAALAVAAPPGSSFAMSEHGLPGALAPDSTIIDLLGLHDRYFALHGFSAEELFRRRPDVIWLPHEDHAQMLRDIVGSDEFWTHYEFYPDAFYYGIALRSDGAHHDKLSALLALQWRRTYPDADMREHRAVRGEVTIHGK